MTVLLLLSFPAWTLVLPEEPELAIAGGAVHGVLLMVVAWVEAGNERS